MTRKTISLLTCFSFLAIILSSVALYVLPGRQGGSLDQLLLFGIHKQIWKNIHITGGFLFIITAAWHTVLNLKPLLAHMGKRARPGKRTLAPMLAAAAITTFVYAGTVYGLEPMRSVLYFPKSIYANTTQTTAMDLTNSGIPMHASQQ